MSPRRLVATLAAVLSLTLGLAVPAVGNSAGPRDDADYTEHYFPAGDGVTMLHADVLRPKGLADDVPTPVIMAVSPYTNHSGSLGPFGLIQNPPYEPFGEGPYRRFYDFLDLSGALEQGYTYVQVDLPGFGGSGGCNDWGGKREQDAVRAAVEWAASQPWSNGRVALMGKSYDGWTGLMGIGQQPKGLAAVLALEPVYSGYRYLYMNGVRRQGTYPTTIALFQVIDATPGTVNDSPQYHANSAPQAWCYGVNLAGAVADDDQYGPYWTERDLLLQNVGRTTPLFLTQGFLETNTRPDGAFQYYNGLAGRQNRAWFGQFDHCRGWETERACNERNDDRLALGREEFIDQVMRFLDEHLKGIEPEVEDPAIEVQDIHGRWRAEDAWPPADSTLFETELAGGTYADSGTGNGLRPTASQGIWSISEPLPHDVWLAGEPVISASVNAVPNANLTANVYDIGPDGAVAMISRGTTVLRGTGTRTATFTLYGQDWPLAAGHRIGVLIGSANTEEFLHVATRADVTVHWAKVNLPFLSFERTEFIDGAAVPPRLERFHQGNTAVLSDATIESAERAFTLPPPLRPRV